MDIPTQTLINFIIGLAKDSLHPREIILFGSRARGDARPKSDYDIAFDFDKNKYQLAWGKFCIEAAEQAPTLLPMDLVNMNEISADFASKIHDEGIVVYKGEKNERTATR